MLRKSVKIIKGILVGETLMRAGTWKKKSKGIAGVEKMTEIKICGLTTKAAIDTAIQSETSYLGFVFAESPRKITLKTFVHLHKVFLKSKKSQGVCFTYKRIRRRDC